MTGNNVLQNVLLNDWVESEAQSAAQLEAESEAQSAATFTVVIKLSYVQIVFGLNMWDK